MMGARASVYIFAGREIFFLFLRVLPVEQKKKEERCSLSQTEIREREKNQDEGHIFEVLFNCFNILIRLSNPTQKL